MIELSLEDCWGEDGTYPQVEGHVDRREFRRALRRLAKAEGWDWDSEFFDDIEIQHAYAVNDPYADDGEYRWWQLSAEHPLATPFPITIANLDDYPITCQVAKIPGPPCPDCGYRKEVDDDQEHDHCDRCDHAWNAWCPHFDKAPGHQMRTCSRCGMFEHRDALADRRVKGETT